MTLTLYDPRGLLMPPSLRNFALTHLILELHYCALGTFPKKIVLHRVAKKSLIGAQGLAVMGVLKYKFDVIFIIFCEFSIILEIVDSQLCD